MAELVFGAVDLREDDRPPVGRPKHLDNVYAKLGVRSRAQAVARVRTPPTQ